MQKFFRIEEFDQPYAIGSGANMNPDFILKLEKLREITGIPMKISSGWRSPQYNEKIGGEPNSAHLLGRAVDIECCGEAAFVIVKCAMNYGFYGIGVKQEGDIRKRFVHLDDIAYEEFDYIPRPRLWSY